MSHKKVVLDASALISLINNEKGAEIVEEALPRAVMSSVNCAEVMSWLINQEGYSSDKALNVIESLVYEVIDFDIECAAKTAELIVLGKKYGLSMTDRACIALGIITSCPILTADRICSELSIENLTFIQIR